MKTAALSIKIDPKVKREAQKVADELGFSLSALVNAYFKDFVRTKSVSFTIAEPSPRLQKIITTARIDRQKGKTKGPFGTIDGLMKSLNS